MTAVGKLLSHHDGKMVTRKATRSEKPRLRKGAHVTSMGVSRGIVEPMYVYTPRHYSRYDSRTAFDQSSRSGGVRA